MKTQSIDTSPEAEQVLVELLRKHETSQILKGRKSRGEKRREEAGGECFQRDAPACFWLSADVVGCVDYQRRKDGGFLAPVLRVFVEHVAFVRAAKDSRCCHYT